MKTSILLKKMYTDGRDFITSDEVGEYCRLLELNYNTILRYLLSRKYVIRIFRGIFYLRTPEEIKLGRNKYSPLELVSKGLGMKGVKKWYFGLYSALKMNNMTHENFTVDCVMNDKIFRAKPMEIAGSEFRFLKIRDNLLDFGIIGDKMRHSDPEKTILDFIYIWRYNGIPEEKIIMDISEYSKNVSRKKLAEYAKKYPKSVRMIADKVIV